MNSPRWLISIYYILKSLNCYQIFQKQNEEGVWNQALYGNQLLRKENMDLLFIKHIPAGGGYYGYSWAIYEMPLGNTAERIETGPDFHL
ncbi:MAG: hypothetical protein ABWZ79_17875 [Pedobacter agri]